MIAPNRIASLLLCAGALHACGSNNIATKAKVTGVERTCAYKTTNGDTRNGSCHQDISFAFITTGIETNSSLRPARLTGTSKVTITYPAPGNGRLQTATLEFDGSEDAFYLLRPGSDVTVLVDKTDPTEVSKL